VTDKAASNLTDPHHRRLPSAAVDDLLLRFASEPIVQPISQESLRPDIATRYKGGMS